MVEPVRGGNGVQAGAQARPADAAPASGDAGPVGDAGLASAPGGDAAAMGGGGRASGLALGAPSMGGSDAEFVRGLYRSILGREAEQAGFEHHMKLLAGGMTREQMTAAIMGSQERKNLEAGRRPSGPARPGGPGNPGKPGVVRDGPGGFLWKPVSDSTGKLAVLLPPQYAGVAQAAYLVGPDGERLEKGQDGGVGNGDRQHYRFSKPGGKYPPGTTVVVELANGETATWTVKNTNHRND